MSQKQTKNTLKDLETLHESHEAAEQIKRELFEHNALLHAANIDVAPYDQDETPAGVIPTPEPRSRESFVEAQTKLVMMTEQPHALEFAGIIQANIRQLAELQMLAMSSWMQNWATLFSGMQVISDPDEEA